MRSGTDLDDGGGVATLQRYWDVCAGADVAVSGDSAVRGGDEELGSQGGCACVSGLAAVAGGAGELVEVWIGGGEVIRIYTV